MILHIDKATHPISGKYLKCCDGQTPADCYLVDLWRDDYRGYHGFWVSYGKSRQQAVARARSALNVGSDPGREYWIKVFRVEIPC